jgi:drug/metabolite transporter (DMT)-like permease
MIGQFFALLSAVSISGGNVFIRKAVFRIGEPNGAFYISHFIGIIIFSLALAFSGDAGQLTTLSGKALASLVGAGILGGVMARWLLFFSLRIIGANLASPLLNTSIIVAVIMGVMLMGDSVTSGKISGIVLIVIGVMLISTEGGDSQALSKSITRRDMIKGIVSALSAGICWGISPVLSKTAIDEGNSPIIAAFVVNATSIVLVLAILLRYGERRKLSKVDRGAFSPVLFSSILASMALFFRYWALEYSPVSVVQPLNSTASLFTIFLSFIVNRKIEVFTWKIIVGAVLVVSGVFLIFQLD